MRRARRRRPCGRRRRSAARTAIDLVVVGPEAPLVAGLADDLAAAGIQAFGPSAGRRAARRLEGLHQGSLRARPASRPRAYRALHRRGGGQGLCARRRARRSSSRPTGSPPARASSSPTTVAEADAAIDAMLRRRARRGRRRGRDRGVPRRRGGELLRALRRHDRALPLGTAQDHKRAFDGDTGPNTGGMGAYSPAPVLTPEIEARVDGARSSRRRSRRCAARGTPFTGVLYAGLMITRRRARS